MPKPNPDSQETGDQLMKPEDFGQLTIARLEIENIGKHEHLTLRWNESDWLDASGKGGVGKTWILRAIEWLRDGGLIPDLVHEGAASGSVLGIFTGSKGQLEVLRSVKTKRSGDGLSEPALKLTWIPASGKGGSLKGDPVTLAQPQTVLDAIFPNKYCLRPLLIETANLSPASRRELVDQLQASMKLSKATIDLCEQSGFKVKGMKFSDVIALVDGKIKTIENDRELTGREKKRLQGYVDSARIPEEYIGVKKINVDHLLDEQRQLSDQDADQANLRLKVTLAKRSVADTATRIVQVEAELGKLKTQQAANLKVQVTAEQAVKDLPDVSKALEEVAQRISEASKTNGWVQKSAEFDKHRKEFTALSTLYNKQAQELAGYRTLKAALADSAKLAVPDVEIEDGFIKFKGYRFESGCTNDSIITSLKLGMMLEPAIRFVVIESRAELDSEHFRDVREFCAEHGFFGLSLRMADKVKTLTVKPDILKPE